ncbi:MAG: GNAT family N-acetyltransferase [Clostridia bacterium]|jgi:GNAT superfamily N-acetyltransferase|nr:GNAT family N-acetyltransferase [Clostridia bacterium]MBQ4364963.1 GNAT family N-acetyltransferase [Clostridia bacterium]
MRITPSAEYLTQLHTLWKDVFGDEDGYIDLFFARAFPSCHPFAVIENGEVQSVLYLLDCRLQAGRKLYDGYYLYAAATKPQYRRKGLMRSLIEEAKAFLHETGKDFIVLLPAGKSLYDYYEKFGFVTKLYRWAGTLQGAGQTPPDPITNERYASLPAGGFDRFLWTDDNLLYALDCQAFYDSLPYTGGKTAFLFDGKQVHEVVSDSPWNAQFDLIAALPKGEYIPVYAPWALPGFQKQPYGMLYTADRDLLSRSYYMNFALD